MLEEEALSEACTFKLSDEEICPRISFSLMTPLRQKHGEEEEMCSACGHSFLYSSKAMMSTHINLLPQSETHYTYFRICLRVCVINLTLVT